MPAVGGASSESERRAHAIKHLTPGRVLRLLCDFTTPIKPKLLVVAAPDHPLLVFVINSQMSSLAKANPHLKDCQVLLTAKDHSFLDHDSYLACHECYRLDREEVIRQLTGDPSKIRGELTGGVRTAVRDVAEKAITLTQNEKNRILVAL